MATSVPWYLVLQEVMTTKVDCDKGCKITPGNNQQNLFHRIARTRATSHHSIARRTMMSMFFMLYRNEQTTTTTFLHQLQGSKQKQVV
jgi:hypothetical protein